MPIDDTATTSAKYIGLLSERVSLKTKEINDLDQYDSDSAAVLPQLKAELRNLKRQLQAARGAN